MALKVQQELKELKVPQVLEDYHKEPLEVKVPRELREHKEPKELFKVR